MSGQERDNMFNGKVLKICFLMIVGTMCFLLIALTFGVSIGKLPMDEYMRLVGTLGISSLFGVIIQAFVHANITESAKSDYPKPSQDAPQATKTGQTISEYLLLICMVFLVVVAGCVSAKLSGTGINAQSPEYGNFSANSVNAEIDVNADD